jgi:vacuolar protein sorting-associated protein 45
MAKGKQFFSSIFKDVQNVLLQHKPLLMNVIDQAFKGKLSQTEYPAMQTNPTGGGQIGGASNLIVFVVGGVTYEEAKEIAVTYNQGSEVRVLIGGNVVHNSKSFMADIS